MEYAYSLSSVGFDGLAGNRCNSKIGEEVTSERWHYYLALHKDVMV